MEKRRVKSEKRGEKESGREKLIGIERETKTP